MKILFGLLLLFWLGTQSISGQEPHFQTGHTHDLVEVKFSPDDTQLLSYSAGDGRLCLWDVASGQLRWMTKTEFVHRLQEFYWSRDNRTLVTKNNRGQYQTWNLRSGKILSIVNEAPDIPCQPEPPKRISVSKEQDPYTFSRVGGQLALTHPSFSRTGNVFDVSHDGTLVAEGGSWGDACLKITRTETGESRFFDGHPGIVQSIAYSPDGKFLAVGGNDRNLYLFDAIRHTWLKTLTGHTEPVVALSFGEDGKTLVSATAGTELKVWNWPEGSLVQTLTLPGLGINQFHFSFHPDGRSFLRWNDVSTLELWDLPAGTCVFRFKPKENHISKSGQMTATYDGVPVTCARFSRTGKQILSSHRDGTLRIWDIAMRKQIRKFTLGKPVVCFEEGAEGHTMIAGIDDDDEVQLQLLDLITGKKLAGYDPEASGFTTSVSLSPDGKHFATATVTGDVFLWEVHHQNPLHQLDIGFSGKDALAFSPEGKTLAVGGRNQNLFFFEVESGQKKWQLLPDYQPGELEIRLTREKELRQKELDALQARRDQEAERDAPVFARQVILTFAHFGDMANPLSQRMVESDQPNLSQVKKSRHQSNAVWLRLQNDSPLPMRIPTQSLYLSAKDCFFEFPTGEKTFGFCDKREISMWFGLENAQGKPLPYGFDFGASSVLLPKTSVVFAVPQAVLKKQQAIRFDFVFLKPTANHTIEPYGKEITLRFRAADIQSNGNEKR